MAAGNSQSDQSATHSFGQLLRRLRQAADFTQEELAERSGVSARLISDIERGTIKRSRRDTVQMLADGLNLNGVERESFVATGRGRRAGTDTSPPQTTHTTWTPPAGGIIGRERELAATAGMLLQSSVRLLTLTGTGGVGKTRLALEVAHRVSSEFTQGMVFVDLAAVSSAELVPQVLLRALSLRDSGNASPIEQIATELQAQQILIVLDNMEHLIESGSTIAQILQRCPRVTMLATSRRALRLRVEREYPLAPLVLPDLQNLPAIDELQQVPSIELFVRHAEAVRQSFSMSEENARAVAEIAVRLEGLPLAIELAAARMLVLSPAELLVRLEPRLPLLTGGPHDGPDRHRTMRATIDWSHDLLDEDERRLFRQLAVFTGGISIDALEAVCLQSGEDELSQVVQLDLLTSLVEKNLLRVVEPRGSGKQWSGTRYTMLETVREFGLEQLPKSGDEIDLRARHARWCVELAERAEPELTGADQDEWLTRLGVEHANLQAAILWSIAQGDWETALRLCGALYRFWVTEAFFVEGRRLTERALELAPSRPTFPAARSLLGVGVIAYFQADYDAAEQYTQRARDIYLQLDDPAGIAYSSGNLGLLADVREDYPLAVERYEQALASFREIGDQSHAGFMLGNLGLIAYFQGDYGRATTLLQESLDNARARGDQNAAAISLGNLGLVAMAQGALGKAQALQIEALRVRSVSSNKSHMARSLENLALVASAMNEAERSVQLFGAADALRTAIGAPLQPGDAATNARSKLAMRRALGDDAFEICWSIGSNMPLDEVVAFALTGSTPAESPSRNSQAAANPRTYGDNE